MANIIFDKSNKLFQPCLETRSRNQPPLAVFVMNQQPMTRKNSDRPEILEIRKYQNRRYYDTTRSQHVGLAQIHKLIIEGYDIRVIDSQTEEDITARILTQILLDYEPIKLALFSTELLSRAIRVNDRLLKDFVDLYFRQAFEAFCASQKKFEEMMREAHQLTSALASPATWMRGLFPPWAQPATGATGETQSSAAPAERKKVAAKADASRKKAKRTTRKAATRRQIKNK